MIFNKIRRIRVNAILPHTKGYRFSHVEEMQGSATRKGPAAYYVMRSGKTKGITADEFTKVFRKLKDDGLMTRRSFEQAVPKPCASQWCNFPAVMGMLILAGVAQKRGRQYAYQPYRS